MENCKARQYNDQMICGQCGLQWDIDDEDPPKCMGVGEKTIKEIKQDLTK